MQIRLFYKLLERARTVDINKFINTLDGWFNDNCFCAAERYLACPNSSF